jgi:AcrR family transcriptional regulator
MTEDERIELPASIETAWGTRERTTKGPRPGLSLERIVDAAIKVASTEGLAALSMNRVARELGSSAMSLYRYVNTKDELLLLMVDGILGPITETWPEPPAWREGLRQWAGIYREALRRHPWVLRIPIGGPPITPNQLAWLDRGLRMLRSTALEEGEKLSIMLLISGYVRNDATLMADIAAASSAIGITMADVMPRYDRFLRQMTDADRFPDLHAVIDAGVFSGGDDPDYDYAFGLERILDGIDALMQRRRSGDVP